MMGRIVVEIPIIQQVATLHAAYFAFGLAMAVLAVLDRAPGTAAALS